MDNAPPPPGVTSRWPWFRDQIWTGQEWQPNPTPGFGPGCLGGGPGSLYVPSARSRTATRLWAGIFGVLWLLCMAGLIGGEDAEAVIISGVLTVVMTALFGLALYTMLSNQSRRITWDSQGLSDGHDFGVRRVPWTGVHALVRENSAAARQRSYDEARRSSSSNSSRGSRPRDIWVWVCKDAEGRALLDFMEPDGDEHDAHFSLLHERITQQLRLQGRLVEEPDDDDASEDDADDSMPPDQQREMQAAFDAMARRQGTLGRTMAAVVLLPLALLALYATWNAAWYEWAAERAQGTVVEHIVTGKDRALVQLVIAWRDASGQERQLTTDGTRGHAEIAIESPIAVLFDPARPEDARPALFLEVWLWTLVAWAFFALMAGAMALVTGAFSRKPAGPGQHNRR